MFGTRVLSTFNKYSERNKMNSFPLRTHFPLVTLISTIEGSMCYKRPKPFLKLWEKDSSSSKGGSREAADALNWVKGKVPRAKV